MNVKVVLYKANSNNFFYHKYCDKKYFWSKNYESTIDPNINVKHNSQEQWDFVQCMFKYCFLVQRYTVNFPRFLFPGRQDIKRNFSFSISYRFKYGMAPEKNQLASKLTLPLLNFPTIFHGSFIESFFFQEIGSLFSCLKQLQGGV